MFFGIKDQDVYFVGRIAQKKGGSILINSCVIPNLDLFHPKKQYCETNITLSVLKRGLKYKIKPYCKTNITLSVLKMGLKYKIKPKSIQSRSPAIRSLGYTVLNYWVKK